MSKEYDITPELALAAYNTLIQFCRQQETQEDGTCRRCVLYENCPAITDCVPEEWEELHYPRLIGNTIEYLKDGQIHKITCSDRQDAEKKLEELRNDKT